MTLLLKYDNIGDNDFEIVRNLKYCGSVIADDNTMREEIKPSLQAGNRSYWAFALALLSF